MMTKYDKLPPCLSSYTIISELGRGAFSTVYKIKYLPNDKIFCLKKINQKKNNHKFNEVAILQSLHHLHLVTFISSYTDDNYLYIIMEYCEYGDLYTLLRSVQKKNIFINEDALWDIAYQTLLGLEYIHERKIIHRDIKLLNIFMNKDKIIKIGDLGMSKLYEKKELIQSRVGTPLYLPPELVKKEQYDFKVDIWSFGCSLYHLSKCQPPFNEENMIKLGNAIVNDTPPELPDVYSEAFKEFLSLLMTKQKEIRPSASEAIEYIPNKIKEKYKAKVCKTDTDIMTLSYRKKPQNTIENNGVTKDQLTRHGSTNNTSSIGNAGLLFKKQMRSFKKKSGLINFNINKKMNGTQEGFFKFFNGNSIIDSNKPKNKTQSNFFNMNANFMNIKGPIEKQNNHCKYHIDVQNELDDFEEKQNERTSVFPIIGLKTNVINRGEKTKEKEYNEVLFRKTYPLFRTKNIFAKPLTINDIN